MRVRRTLRAERDVRDILLQTSKLFGARQVLLYADLIDRAVDLVGQDPRLPASRFRSEIKVGLRSLRLDSIGPPRTRASHLLFYSVPEEAPSAAAEVLIVRVLHERMSPAARIASALREDVRRSSRPRPPRSPDR